MVIFVAVAAILTVLATGLQFVGLFLPMWWKWSTNENSRYSYICGLWKLPWKLETCETGGPCRFYKPIERFSVLPTWLVVTRIFEVLGASLGVIIVFMMLGWLLLLGPKKAAYLKKARKLGFATVFLQITAGICINIGILILVIKTAPSEILIGTLMSGISFILFCIAGAISYHSNRRLTLNSLTSCHQGDNPLSMSVISGPQYDDPPPSYDLVMSGNYPVVNPSVNQDSTQPQRNKL